MPAFIDIDFIKNLPLIQLPDDDSVTDQFIETASAFVEDYLDRHVAAVDVTERIVGNGRYTLTLDEYPVNSLGSISSGGYSGTYTHSPSDFLIHSGAGIIEWIDKIHNNFREDRVYVVTYNAGYATIPLPIQQATALQVMEMMQPMFGGEIVFQPGATPETSVQFVELLEKYRRKRIS